MAKVKLGNVKGPQGEQGVRGSEWRVSDKMTGQSTSGTAFPGAGFGDSIVNDVCLNPVTFDLYRCQVAGDAATAKWVWECNIKGGPGPKGPKGDPTTVDAALSATSTNPVQNKVVTQKFTDVQDSLGRLSTSMPRRINLEVTPGGSYTVPSDGVYVLTAISKSPTNSNAWWLRDGIEFFGVNNGEACIPLLLKKGAKLTTRSGEDFSYFVRCVF